MSSLDLELDARIDGLELGWRMVGHELGTEAAEVIERRWFELLSAIRGLQGECGILLEASKLADVAWRRACAQLAQFESLREALEEQMSARPSLALKQAMQIRPETRSGFRGAGKHWPAATAVQSVEIAGP
jgi:hypothetical protein